jgi:TRAP-type C4-dicarboxylate transport system permease small subunit
VRRLQQAAGALSRAAAAIAAIATLGCLALVAISVVARYVFGTPLPWIDHVAGWLVVAVVMLAMAEAQRRGEHISVDPPRRFSGPRAALATGLVGVASVLAVALVLLHEGFETVGFSRMVGVATNIEGVPAWWLHALIPVGAGLLAIVASAQLLAWSPPARQDDTGLSTRE